MEINRKKPLETEKKPLATRKRHSAPTQETEQVVPDDPGESKRCKGNRAMIDHFSDHFQSLVMERAQEIQANLAAEFPSLVKLMLHSHVTRGFWLGLPSKFCNLHLPLIDTTIILEDESGKEYDTKYLAGKVGLSAGWRGFSIAHKILEGDVVVFQLVKPTKFKVYIVRSNSLDEVDGALGLLNLEVCSKQMNFERDTKTYKRTEEKCLVPLPLDIPQKNTKMVVYSKNGPETDQSENDSDDLGSEVLEGIRFSESIIDFKEVNGIENFNVLVSGLIIDSELSKHVHSKYYELCCSKKAYLHDQLLEGINCKLVAGIISETVNIADAIRACKVTTSQDAFTVWDKTLKAFEGLGMNVGFLRARLERLSSLAFESEMSGEASLEGVVHEDEEMRKLLAKLLEAKEAAKRIDEEMRTLQAKFLEAKEATKRIDAEIEALKVNYAKRIELMFQEEANAPW